MPDEVMDALGPRVYGCDICQDVCPWNRGVERRRQSLTPPDDATSTVDLDAWLDDDPAALAEPLERLFVPRNDPRWLRRNALVALGNDGTPDQLPLARRYADGADELLAAVARRAVALLEARGRS
jgi:epoxyqueuosine reductase